MIIDATIFAGEMDMLGFRMKILSPYVDKVLVCENLYTHQGNARSYSLDWSCWTAIPTDGKEHTVENGQRNAIEGFCEQFSPEDIIIFADIDEIPSRETMAWVREHPEALPCSVELDYFYYRLNHRRPDKTSIPIATVADLRKFGGATLRDVRNTFPRTPVKPSGWHLSFFGGTRRIQDKLRSYGHWQFNRPEFLDEAWLEQCQRDGMGLLKCGTQCRPTKPDFFPQYFLDAAPKEWWL